jgi:hypothetical protein
MSEFNPKIKAIETRYAGRLFRSRLEARWAVLLDCLRWDWEYEYEGYNLPSGKYLPDFYFPKLKTFGEVKPDILLPKERKKCIELSELFEDVPILLFIGTPDYGHISTIRNGGDCMDVVPVAKNTKYYPLYYQSIGKSSKEIEWFKEYFEDTTEAIISANEARFEFEHFNRGI